MDQFYHLNLCPGDVAKTIMLVGDPGRVSLIAGFFDTIELKNKIGRLIQLPEHTKVRDCRLCQQVWAPIILK